MKKQKKLKIITLMLTTCAILNLTLPSIYASNTSGSTILHDDLDAIQNVNGENQPYLGGGPSPSAAFELKSKYSYTFSSKTLNEQSAKYQSIINSNSYKAGKFAYDVSLIALSFMGKKVGPYSSAGIALFGQTYHSSIQKSANVLASAAAKKKSVKLNVKEYIRPATGEKMILYY